MVERLAKKWVEKTYNPIPDEVDRKTARWWLNAIADEIPNVNNPMSLVDFASWLLAQAKEDNPHDEQNATQPDSNREG